MAPVVKLLVDFIDEIPDEKLTGFGTIPGTIYRDIDFRLDMQGMTTGSKQFNIQIQANKGAKKSSVRKLAPKTVSHILVPVDATWTAAEVRAKLKAAEILSTGR